ncbi:hypothetical protein [Streptomyces gulbargensis]|uniref:hypothetical protein n=1 Tax=Streptomyces gulbargensis TaxID=364901 RepID=UPI0031E68264
MLDELTAAGADILTGTVAQTEESFRLTFQTRTGQEFTPSAFRAWRLGLLARAQAMVIVRTELSESGAFEIAYNSVITRAPMLFAVHTSMPITTTLLQDLNQLCPTSYVTFDHPTEIATPLRRFLRDVHLAPSVSAAALAHRLDELRLTLITTLDTADPVVAACASALVTAQGLLHLATDGPTGTDRDDDLHDALATARDLVGKVTNAIRAHSRHPTAESSRQRPQ